MSMSLFSGTNKRGANATQFIRANLITPELTGVPPRQINAGFILSIIGALALAYAATQHFSATDSITQAEVALSLTPTAPPEYQDVIREHRETKEQLETTQTKLAGLTKALATPRNISALLTEAITPLPGVGSDYPQVVLTRINASIIPPESIQPYGLKPSEAQRVLLSVQLQGEANTSFVIPDALRAYQSDPKYATNFRGTSIERDKYTFDLSLLRLTPPTQPQTEAEENP